MNRNEILYVSAVPGAGVVSRFGLGNVLIGARRDPQEPRRLLVDPEEVVAIHPAELRRYFREYARALREGSLKSRTKEERDAWVKKAEDAATADAEKAEAQVASTVPARPPRVDQLEYERPVKGAKKAEPEVALGPAPGDVKGKA